MVFAEGPLGVTVSVSEFKERVKWYREEPFGDLGENWSEVDGAVVVGVVFGTFFVKGCQPVKFPEFGPFWC